MCSSDLLDDFKLFCAVTSVARTIWCHVTRWLMGMNWEGYGWKQSRTISKYYCRIHLKSEENHEKNIRVIYIEAEVHTRHFPNTNRKSYRLLHLALFNGYSYWWMKWVLHVWAHSWWDQTLTIYMLRILVTGLHIELFVFFFFLVAPTLQSLLPLFGA
jgi:hypothetical protein